MDLNNLVIIQKQIQLLEDIEDLLAFNLSYGVPIKDSLEEIKRLDLLEYFNDIFSHLP
jgi:hypothetical protein